MCVIIQRNPGIIIPEFKIESACHVNPNGFGFSVIDRGKIETVKVCEDSGNNPKDVLKALEDAKDHQIFLHLRYTTAGKTSQENCHPFVTFEGDGYQIMFMHNGTLYKYDKKDDYPDTHHFNEDILKPLFTAFYHEHGKDVLSVPAVKTILEEFKGGSAFALYDSEGNKLLIEKSESKHHDGWWSSNEYSFNRYHRGAAAATKDDKDEYENYWKSRYSGSDYRDPYKGYRSYHNSYSPKASDNKALPAPIKDVKQEPAKTTAVQSKKVGYAIMQAKKNNIPVQHLTAPIERMTFVEMAQIDKLEQIMVLTEDELYDIVEDCPLAATALIMDLIYELYEKKQSRPVAGVTVVSSTTNKAA